MSTKRPGSRRLALTVVAGVAFGAWLWLRDSDSEPAAPSPGWSAQLASDDSRAGAQWAAATSTRTAIATPPLASSSLSARLVGRVAPGGCKQVADVRVVAFAQSAAPSELELCAGADIEQRLLFARTDAHGAFEIDGIAPGMRYFVTAVDDGAMAREPIWNASDSSGELVLVLGAVYRACVRIETDASHALEVDACVRSTRGVKTAIPASLGLVDVSARRLELSLCAPAVPAEFTSRRIYERWFLSPRELAQHGIGTLDVRVPGYESTRTELLAYRAVGATPEQRVALLPSGVAFGALVLRVRPPTWRADPHSLESAPTTPGDLRLVLQHGSGDQVEIEFDSSAYSTVGQHVRLPIGVYEGYIASSRGTYRHPRQQALRLVVSSGASACEVEAPLTDSGALELELVDDFGETFRGPIVVRVRAEGERGWRHLEFAAPPYVLGALAPGRLVFAAMQPFEFQTPGAEPWRGEADIAPGARLVARLTSQRDD